MYMPEQDYDEEIQKLEERVPGHPARAVIDDFRERGATAPSIMIEVTSKDVTLLWCAPHTEQDIGVCLDVTLKGELIAYIRYHGIPYFYTGQAGVERVREVVAQINELYAKEHDDQQF
jgi:hypothetical protein